MPASIVSKLQANPDINYVFYSFGDLPGGVTAALQSAGLDKKVTQYGQDFSTIDLDEITAGTMGAWSADPKGYAGWLMVDAAARLSLGMTLDEERAAPRCRRSSSATRPRPRRSATSVATGCRRVRKMPSRSCGASDLNLG